MSLGKSILWVFCLGSGPFFVVSGLLLFVLLFPLAKRKSGWGICGSSWFGGLVCFCFVFRLRFACSYGPTVPLYKRLFDSLCSCKDRALARHRPNSRKKNDGVCDGYLFTFLPLLSLSGPSLRARSAATEENKKCVMDISNAFLQVCQRELGS